METEYTKKYKHTLFQNNDVNQNNITKLSFAVEVEDAFAETEVETTHLLELHTDYDVRNLFNEGDGYNWQADNEINSYLNKWLNRKSQRFLRTNIRFVEAFIPTEKQILKQPFYIWINPDKGYTWELLKENEKVRIQKEKDFWGDRYQKACAEGWVSFSKIIDAV